MRYADPETLLAEWLHGRLNVQFWADPDLPPDWPFTAPIGHLQRSDGDGDLALTLDSGIFDLNFYGKDPDLLRALAEQARFEIRFNLPGHTWADGLTVNSTATVSAPVWRPDPSVYRRGASYRVILHGLI